MSERMPEDMPDKVPECLPDRTPEDLPDRMSEDLPEDMPGRMLEDMPDWMPEYLPVTKRIDVMVGITRSKEITDLAFFFCVLVGRASTCIDLQLSLAWASTGVASWFSTPQLHSVPFSSYIVNIKTPKLADILLDSPNASLQIAEREQI